MEDTRTMKDDLKKAGHTPSSVAAAFNDSLQGRASASPSAADSLNSSNPADLGIGNSAVASPPRPPSNLPFIDVEPAKEQSSFSSYQPISPQTPPPAPPANIQMNQEYVYESDKKPILKWAIIGVAVLAVLGGGFFAYTQFFNTPESTPIVDNDINSTPSAPASLVSVANTIEIVLDPTDKLEDLMKEKVNMDSLTADSFYQVVVYDSETSSYLGVNEVLSQLGSEIPASVGDLLAEEYTLFVYKQKEGLRYGLAIKTNGVTSAELATWEPNMAKDLSFLFWESKSFVPATIQFKDGKYKEKSMKYVVLSPTPYALDYALIDDTLFFATSKESMFGLIDQL